MQWLEISLNTKPEKIEELSVELELLGVSGLIVEDEQEYEDFLEHNRQYWDYVDEELRDSYRGLSRIRFYVEDSEDGKLELERLRRALPEENFSVQSVRDEDWENNWKQYYKPLSIGEKLLIVPQWEEVPEHDGKVILKLDPGLIFGTGSHATTRMCLEKLQEMEMPGKRVLDLGCGSGILAIASLLLGAEEADGIDIDPKAPDVVMENAALNGITSPRLRALAGDVLAEGPIRQGLGETRYDIVLANIVADVILALAPSVREWMAPGGVFLCSGIIEGRQHEVLEGLKKAGLTVVAHETQEDWHCILCR